MTSHHLFKIRQLRMVTLAVVATAALLLSGCNSGGEPNDGGTVAPSATATESPNPTPTTTPIYKPADATGRAQNVPVPVLPDVAKTETKEGALAFGSYFFNVLSYAYETGDLTLFQSVAPESCASCQKSSEAIRAWHSEGRWLAGGKLTTPTVETTFSKDVEAKYKVAVQVHQEPLSYFRADGTLARTEPQAADTGNLLVLSFQNNSWTLHEVGSIAG